MALQIKVHRCKFISENSLVLVSNAVNVAMNEVILDDGTSSKTYVTDALATCAAVGLYSVEPGFSVAFTHMASATSETDDKRKEGILDEMLEYLIKTIPLAKIQMVVSTSNIPETHLIGFLIRWAIKKDIKMQFLTHGADSAVLHVNEEGNPLMLSTSLTLKEQASKKWCGHGILQASSNPDLASTYQKKAYPKPFFTPVEKKEVIEVPGTALTA